MSDVWLLYGKIQVKILNETDGSCLVQVLQDYSKVKHGERVWVRKANLEKVKVE